MPEGQVLEFSQVTKRFGAVTAVSDLSVRVQPGAVTGFLGPNGAGKTTSLRILLGQIRATSGTATIGGASYSELRNPLRTVGAVLEESAYRPRRTASRQLMLAAKANGISPSRVDEVLRLVGLQDDANTRLGSYSLGMRQRLSVAAALLGDPGVLVLDEPANGLDPEGIRWMRLLMRRLADEGRTVLVSSHVLSEIEQVADDVVVLSKGRAVHAGPIADLAESSGGAVVVDAENRAPLITALSAAKLDFDVLRSGVTVRGSDAAAVGAVAAAAGVALTLLQQRSPSLEEVFLDLVYGRRADSPRLDEVANPVAHAPSGDAVQTNAADTALVASGVPVAGAAAVVADGGVVDGGAVDAGAAHGGVVDAGAAVGGAVADEEPGDGADPIDAAPEAAADDAEASGADEADADADDTPEEAEVEPPAGAESETDADAGADSPSDSETTADEAPTAVVESAPDSEDDVESEDDGASESALESESAPEADDDTESETAPESENDAESEDPAESEEATESEDAADTKAPADVDLSDETRPLVLPLATEAVTLPSAAIEPTFTELITGLPASVTVEGADSNAPATEAISIATPDLTREHDDDDSVDDSDDDPRLAAMRTSLSDAASRFFDGPAPDYPYSRALRSDRAHLIRESERESAADDAHGQSEDDSASGSGGVADDAEHRAG
ncbi:ABC transporter ATP-binding protein [Microbacterium sp. USHLN186]|uniref:ABC transporter ATP-binding protein n=1 Tax=Microbacterium sp. USHLN186 TaxID=3081286 RepID=UPI00301A6820